MQYQLVPYASEWRSCERLGLLSPLSNLSSSLGNIVIPRGSPLVYLSITITQILLMKLSLMPTWTCSGPTGCHWCHQVPPVVPRLLPEWVCALKHLVPSWQGPCTHKTGSWCHHLAKDVEYVFDGVEYPRYGPEPLTDDGESLYGLKKH